MCVVEWTDPPAVKIWRTDHVPDRLKEGVVDWLVLTFRNRGHSMTKAAAWRRLFPEGAP